VNAAHNVTEVAGITSNCLCVTANGTILLTGLVDTNGGSGVV